MIPILWIIYFSNLFEALVYELLLSVYTSTMQNENIALKTIT